MVLVPAATATAPPARPSINARREIWPATFTPTDAIRWAGKRETNVREALEAADWLPLEATAWPLGAAAWPLEAPERDGWAGDGLCAGVVCFPAVCEALEAAGWPLEAAACPTDGATPSEPACPGAKAASSVPAGAEDEAAPLAPICV